MKLRGLVALNTRFNSSVNQKRFARKINVSVMTLVCLNFFTFSRGASRLEAGFFDVRYQQFS